MDKKTVFRAASLAALVAFVAVIAQAIVAFSLAGQGVQVQPSSAPVPLGEFVRATNEFPDSALGFFGADSLFILSYLLVFVGLYCLTAERARPFALVGMGAGVFAALMDAAENGFFITYALAAKNGMPLSQPDLPLLYILTNLKWMGAFAALYAFGVVFPRTNRVEWVITALMLAFPLVGILGVANPSLIAVRGLFFLAGMPLFAWYFWRKSVTSNE